MATKPSPLIDRRVIYCGESLDQLRKFPAECVDLIYIDKMMTAYRASNPDFYHGYFASRVVVDQKGTHPGPVEPPPPPPHP
jgi:hypothetical protein